MAAEAATTPYGVRNTLAPRELDAFAFLVGKWQGTGKTKAPDGSPVQFDVTWIGRYILNGMVIADEFHSLTPDGSPYLGISLRAFDSQQGCWIIEYLNVSNSFLRRQVNGQSGTVELDGNSVAVISEDGQLRIREDYKPTGASHFAYSIQLSHDGGQGWEAPSIEISFDRVD